MIHIKLSKRTSTIFYTLLLLSTVLLTSCTHLFYYPSEKTFYEPKKMGHYYREVFFESLDGTRLNAWYFPSKIDNVKGTVLQLHGNAENISTHFLSLVWLTQMGYNLFIFDYRGYRKSDGDPYPEGLYRDAISAMSYVNEKYIKNGEKFYIWGQSLGGIVALKAMADISKTMDVDALIIESAFSSYQRIAREKLAISAFTWIFQPLAYLLVSDGFSPEGSIANISPTPIVVIHGKQDDIVPFHHGERIFSEAIEPKRFIQVESGQHINSMFVEKGKYRKILLDTLSEFDK